MIRHNLPPHGWRKSSHSGDDEPQCVEAQLTDDGLIAIGDSKDRARGASTFTPSAWTSFVGAVQRDVFSRRDVG
ncbi:DUF397 domain-containing protein [Streptomyces netropsis]|uniref:DUF397 domain-containing protein n=1 Tax=Streptomyces netropsis TaxID=55404 RepID=A0A7W7L5J7_STRNE|nr:DUF397 domain-containing protein [Streptomyces netropsis]MBB4884080.1 hypothetical protein [Streptomyces netropsis]GGR06234.1 hypothetical protein GCM10010219_08370 [Streptomyces netropsis]